MDKPIIYFPNIPSLESFEKMVKELNDANKSKKRMVINPGAKNEIDSKVLKD